ncbi:MAG: immune inhibitor A [Deltaproteobacteria bacterium]|nr:immune inhibitor A [Deltaproteobacteria bacterium]
MSVPCQVCDPTKAGDAWTAKEGACDDGDECTRDDYCQEGVCKGTDFHTTCEDKHACTTTHCDGKGACLPSTLDAGACLIDGVCISATGLDGTGCKICDPAKSTSVWSVREKVCKVNDKCYGAGDTHPGAAAACATCVPDAAHEWQPASGHCLLSGKICKKNGDADTTACKTCDPAVDKYAWSAATGRCAIAGKCYAPNAIHPDKCATCDLASSTWGWTVQGSASCLIGNACYAAGASDGSTCSSCQPAQSKVAWTIAAGKCRLNGACYNAGATDPSGCLTCGAGDPRSWLGAGSTTILWQNDFEVGVALPSGMSETHDDTGNDVKWQVVVGRRTLSGNGAIYYGSPAAGDYDNGVRNSGILTVSHLVLPAAKKAGAHFSVYLDIEETYPSGFVATDAIQVRVKGVATPLWIKPGLNQHSKYKTWFDVNVDLSAYAGKTIDLEFSFDTLDDSVNDSEGIYVDDLTIYGG